MLLFRRTKNDGDSATVDDGLRGHPPEPAGPARPRRPGDQPADGGSDLSDHLRVLGLPPDASWHDVTEAYERLVSDLTPGPNATHQNVELAERLLQEVNAAYGSLRILAVA